MNNGDLVTIDEIYRKIPNRDRKWWQFWKPRLVTTDELQLFRVIGPSVSSPEPSSGGEPGQ